jgi:hypothetical protein
MAPSPLGVAIADMVCDCIKVQRYYQHGDGSLDALTAFDATILMLAAWVFGLMFNVLMLTFVF